MTDWLKARLGRVRVSTVVLVVAFAALFWVNQAFQPEPAEPPAPAPAVVPPGFVPDPNYTWVPRTNVRRTTEPEYTTTTTTPTTSPTETTMTSPTPTTTMIDPDGLGPRQPAIETITPTTTESPSLLPDVPQLVPPTTTTTPPS